MISKYFQLWEHPREPFGLKETIEKCKDGTQTTLGTFQSSFLPERAGPLWTPRALPEPPRDALWDRAGAPEGAERNYLAKHEIIETTLVFTLLTAMAASWGATWTRGKHREMRRGSPESARNLSDLTWALPGPSQGRSWTGTAPWGSRCFP